MGTGTLWHQSAFVLAVACSLLALTAPAATADSRIGEPGTGPGGLSLFNTHGPAVSTKEGGDLYVVDGGQDQRVSQFEPDGTFVRAFGWGVVPGAASGSGDLTATSSSVTSVTTTAGQFIVGQALSGPGIPPGTLIVAVNQNELRLSNPVEATETAAPLTVTAGPGNVPTDEVQRLAVAAAGGAFGLAFTSPDPSPKTESTETVGKGRLASASTAVTEVSTATGAFALGEAISGSGIKPNTTITACSPSCASATGLTLSQATEAAVPSVATTLTADLAYDAPAKVSEGPGSVEAALEALPNIGPGNVSVTGGPGDGGGTHPYLIEFKGRYADVNVPRFVSTSALTGPQTVTVGASAPPGGAFTLDFSESTTASIPDSASAGTVQSALEALPNIGPGNVSVTGADGGPWTIAFTGALATSPQPAISAESAGGFVAVAAPGASVSTPTEGALALEVCTTACVGEGDVTENVGQGSGPGQLRYSDEIAVDNDPASASYGDLYIVDQRNFRVEKFSSSGEFLLMFGGEVDKTTGADVCTAEDVQGGDECGGGVPGTAAAHFYAEKPSTETGGVKSWLHEGFNSIAVGPEGTVYVGDYGRIQEFHPDGSFAGEFVLPVGSGEVPQFVTALALDPAGDIYERSAIYGEVGGFATEVRGVREFGPSPAHTLIRTFDAGVEEGNSEPTHFALDPAGDLFVSDYHGLPFPTDQACSSTVLAGCPEEVFRAFKPNGSLFAEFTSPQVQLSSSKAVSSNPGGLAIAPGILYAPSFIGGDQQGMHIAVITLPQKGPPQVSGEHVSDLEPTTATLHAVLNSEQFETRYRFEYTTTNFANCGEDANLHCLQTPTVALGPISRDTAVQAAISGLQPGNAYRWRLVAESFCHEDLQVCETSPEAELETLPDVSVRNLTTQTVGPELVTLRVELNNNSSIAAGHYTLHLGTEAGNYDSESQGTLTAGDSEFEAREATFTGLHPNTTYHYQLEVENGYGHEVGDDREFTTELSTAEERAAEDCPNAILREENNSLALPDCRAYEQVSAAEKKGYAVLSQQLSPGGDHAAYTSLGAFTGDNDQTRYSAERTAAGWLTRPALSRLGLPGLQPRPIVSYDAELDSSLFPLAATTTATDAEEAPAPNQYYIGRSDGSFLPATPEIGILSGARADNQGWDEPIGASADLSHLFLATSYRLLSEDPLPDMPSGTSANRIYEARSPGGPDPSLRLVAEVPSELMEESGCGVDQEFGANARTASTDGSIIFYSAPTKLVKGAGCGPHGGPNKTAVYVCHVSAGPCVAGLPGYHPPTQLSAPSPSQCSSGHPCDNAPSENANFDGSSPNGELAWFTTEQSLVDSDSDGTEDLYLARLDEGNLTELVQASAGEASASHPNIGQGAGVQGVVALSEDGTTAAFVATGVLTTKENGVGAVATQGGDNLYVYDAKSAQISFVGRLEPSDQRLWSQSVRDQSQFTSDGRYLLFSSSARLTPDDTDAAADVYRYDIQNGELIRVSIGRRGNDGNGNDEAYEAEIAGHKGSLPAFLESAANDAGRAISADGSTVIFETAAPLVSRDTDTGDNPGCAFNRKEPERVANTTGCDLYQWQQDGHGTCHEAYGCISLVSSGVDPHGVTSGVIDSSGANITFLTPRGLVPSDTDGVVDIYDARENGGFPYAPPPAPCGGAEVCHHQTSPPPAAPTISSSGETGGNGVSQLSCAKGKVRVKKHGQVRCVAKKHHKKKSHPKKHKRPVGNKRGGGK